MIGWRRRESKKCIVKQKDTKKQQNAKTPTGFGKIARSVAFVRSEALPKPSPAVAASRALLGCRRLPATRRHVPIASDMDPERVRAYLQVACAGLGFDIGEVWFTSNENGSSTVAQIGTLSLLLSSVLCVRFIASCSPKDSQDRSLLLFSHVT